MNIYPVPQSQIISREETLSTFWFSLESSFVDFREAYLQHPWWLSGRVCLPMQEMRVPSLGEEDPLEKGMATHSSILAWRILWMEEPGRLQPMKLQKVQCNLETE